MSNFGSIDDLLKKKSPPAERIEKQSAQKRGGAEEKLTKKIGQISLKEKETETMRFAGGIGYPHISLEKFPISQHALRQVPEETASELGVVCFYATQEEFRLGAIDPTDQNVQNLFAELEERLHAHGALYVISLESLKRVLELYLTLPVVKPITKDIAITAEDLTRVSADINDIQAIEVVLEKTSTTDLITLLLGAALKLNASDVHIEAEEQGIAVRVRLDGILHDAATLRRDMYKYMVSRIKLVSSLKINITDAPQDGRFTIKLPEGDVDVRVSTIPTVYGESIVLRLLRQNRQGLSLESLGIRGSAFERLKREIDRPNGMIITSGPTGSGKTTTLYAVLQILNKPGVKIVTLEDPVEYKMEGINQSQIDPSHDYTFAKGLRSLLRQDPDIVMVGEIRDLETADIAIQAALTGHLILSTIHTNNAAGGIPRFLSMGVKPFLLAPALNSLMGQRLVRRLCDACKKPLTLSPEQQERVESLLASLPEEERKAVEGKKRIFFESVGCPACGGIGYKGQVGIYEVFLMNPDVEQMILGEHVSEFDMEKTAISHGMVTMAQDGVLKALDGVTSLEEVFRVIE
ncbi:MAG: GspE/PulE family protein [Patescibacteria group bacterium]